MESEFKVTVLCLFCQSPLQKKEDEELESGDLIKCESCGEYNDYDSAVKVAEEKAIEKVNAQIQAKLDKTMKNLFK